MSWLPARGPILRRKTGSRSGHVGVRKDGVRIDRMVLPAQSARAQDSPVVDGSIHGFDSCVEELSSTVLLGVGRVGN